MNDQNFRLVTKYALLLSVFAILSFAFDAVLNELLSAFTSAWATVMYTNTLPLAFGLVLNLITAYLVRQDIRKFNVKTSYVTFATIIYRPLGVFSFLLFLFFQQRNRIGIEAEQAAKA